MNIVLNIHIDESGKATLTQGTSPDALGSTPTHTVPSTEKSSSTETPSTTATQKSDTKIEEEQVKQAVMDAVKRVGTKEAKECITRVTGKAKVGDVDPSQYADLIAALELV
jgi:hypothetical protein